jgi:hypothetical protein
MSRKFMEYCIGIFFLTLSFSIIMVGLEVKTSMGKRLEIAEQQLQQQTQILSAANEFKDVVAEAGFAVLARSLESENLMSPTEANRVVTEALEKMTNYSPKLGLLARSLNDAYLKETMGQ